MVKIHNYFSFRKHGQRPQPDRALTSIQLEDLETLQKLGQNRRNSIQGYEHITPTDPERSSQVLPRDSAERKKSKKERAQSVAVESSTKKGPKGSTKRPFFQRFITDGIGRVPKHRPVPSSSAIQTPKFQLYSHKRKSAKSKSKISAPVVIDAFDEANYGRSVPIKTSSTAKRRQEQHKKIPKPIHTVPVHHTHVNPPRRHRTSMHLAPLEAPPLQPAPKSPFPRRRASSRRITRMTDLLRTPSVRPAVPSPANEPSSPPSPSVSIDTTYTTPRVSPLSSPFAAPLKEPNHDDSPPKSPWSDFEFDYQHLRDPVTPMTPSIYPSSPDTQPPSPPLDTRVSTYSVWGIEKVLAMAAPRIPPIPQDMCSVPPVPLDPPPPPSIPEDRRRWQGEGGSPRDSVFYGFWDEVLGKKGSRVGRSRAGTGGKDFYNGL